MFVSLEIASVDYRNIVFVNVVFVDEYFSTNEGSYLFLIVPSWVVYMVQIESICSIHNL